VPAHERDFRTVADVMDREPATIGADADAYDVLIRFSEARPTRALVTESDRFVGVVTGTDITEALEVTEGVRGRDPKGLAHGGFAQSNSVFFRPPQIPRSRRLDEGPVALQREGNFGLNAASEADPVANPVRPLTLESRIGSHGPRSGPPDGRLGAGTSKRRVPDVPTSGFDVHAGYKRVFGDDG
jgi:hypothetical protein